MDAATTSIAATGNQKGHGTFLTRSVVATMLLIAVAGKIINPAETTLALSEVWGLTGFFNQIGYVLICLVEGLLVLWLFSGRDVAKAGLFTFGLLALFTMHIAVQWVVAPELGCGCGLPSLPSNTTYMLAVTRNAALMGLSALLISSSNSPDTPV